jgi:hypothetical protein
MKKGMNPVALLGVVRRLHNMDRVRADEVYRKLHHTGAEELD